MEKESKKKTAPKKENPPDATDEGENLDDSSVAVAIKDSTEAPPSKEDTKAPDVLKKEDQPIFLKSVLDNKPGDEERGIPVNLITRAGVFKGLNTTCRLPEDYQFWNGPRLVYWIIAPLDHQLLSAELLMEALYEDSPITDEILNTAIRPLLLPPPSKIKRTSKELFGFIGPMVFFVRLLEMERLQKDMSRYDKLRTGANIIAPIIIISTLMFMLLIMGGGD